MNKDDDNVENGGPVVSAPVRATESATDVNDSGAQLQGHGAHLSPDATHDTAARDQHRQPQQAPQPSPDSQLVSTGKDTCEAGQDAEDSEKASERTAQGSGPETVDGQTADSSLPRHSLETVDLERDSGSPRQSGNSCPPTNTPPASSADFQQVSAVETTAAPLNITPTKPHFTTQQSNTIDKMTEVTAASSAGEQNHSTVTPSHSNEVVLANIDHHQQQEQQQQQQQQQQPTLAVNSSLSLQELCRDIHLQFRHNSLGLQSSLNKLDNRMAYIERMQFLIRKQSQDMIELRLRVSEAERNYNNGHKKMFAYKKKVNQLQQQLRQMEIEKEVRDKAEREVERRESRRSGRMSQDYLALLASDRSRQAPQVVMVPQSVPIIMTTSGADGARYTGMQQYDRPALQNFQTSQPAGQTGLQSAGQWSGDVSAVRALPAPGASVAEEGQEAADQSAPYDTPQPRRASVLSVRSYRSGPATRSK